MRFAVVGAGGVGGYFGARLAAAGHDVSFLARGAHREVLSRDGLKVTSVEGDFSVSPVRATDDASSIGPVDAVLLAVKTWQLESALPALQPLLGKETAVITLQNGVEAPEQAAQVVGRDAVVPGIVKIIAMLAEPGHVRHMGGLGSLDLAEWDNHPTERVSQIRNAFTAAGIRTTDPSNIWSQLWAKFLFVVPLGGLGAVADAPFGVLRERPGTRRLLASGMAEIAQLAQVMGVPLPADIVETTFAFVDQQPADGTTSLHRDLRAGLPSELDAWTGSVVRLGERTGTPTPIHRFIYEILSLRASLPPLQSR